LIKNKNELINNLEALGAVGMQISTSEYNIKPDNMGEIPENLREEYWASVYEGHDFEELWLILGELSKLNFEHILKNKDFNVEQYKALNALRTNRYLTKAKRAHTVYQICYKQKLGVEIKQLKNEDIIKSYKSNL
jgi:hypothetical protein